MNRLLVLLSFTTLFAACECTGLTKSTRFVCTTSADCAAGFECRDEGQGLECMATTGAGGGAAMGGGAATGGGDATGGGAATGGGTTGGGATGGGAGTGGGSATGGGSSGIPPESLAFVTAEQTVAPSACSQVMLVEAHDDAGLAASVLMDTPLVLSADGGLDGGAISFFMAANCAGSPTTLLTMPTGASSLSFYARADTAGLYELRVTSSTLGDATQPFTVVPPPDELVFTTTPANPVRGGECLPVTLEARLAGAPVALLRNAVIGLTSTPTGAAVFASDSMCNTAITTTQLLAGTSSVNLFVKPLTGGMTTLTATAPFGVATQQLNVTPIVRRFRCDFGARVDAIDGGLPDGGTIPAINALTANCTISPALTEITSTVLLSQATSTTSGSEPGSGLVRCRITTTSSVQCLRRQDQDPAQVLVQLAEIPTGVFVQRATTPTTSTGCSVPNLPTPVDPTKSFILKAVAHPQVAFDDEETQRIALTGPNTVSVTPASCTGLDVQVVQWEGVDVVRGDLPSPGLASTQLTTTVNGLGSAGMRGVVLVQSATTTTSSRPVCNTLVRGAIASPSSITLSRGNGDAGCPRSNLELVHFERLDFNNEANVNSYGVTFAPGERDKTVSISPVDVTRTLVMASSQTAGGQGAGETDFAGSDKHGEGVARFNLENATLVRVVRPESTGSARFTFYVLELTP